MMIRNLPTVGSIGAWTVLNEAKIQLIVDLAEKGRSRVN